MYYYENVDQVQQTLSNKNQVTKLSPSLSRCLRLGVQKDKEVDDGSSLLRVVDKYPSLYTLKSENVFEKARSGFLSNRLESNSNCSTRSEFESESETYIHYTFVFVFVFDFGVSPPSRTGGTRTVQFSCNFLVFHHQGLKKK